MDFEKRVELEALITEREGMMALNDQRAVNGDSPAYTDEQFFDIARQMRALIQPPPADPK